MSESQFFEFPVGEEITYLVGKALDKETYELEPLMKIPKPSHVTPLALALATWITDTLKVLGTKAEPRVLLMNMKDYANLRVFGGLPLEVEDDPRRLNTGLMAQLPTIAAPGERLSIAVHSDIPVGDLWILGNDDDGWIKQGLRIVE